MAYAAPALRTLSTMEYRFTHPNGEEEIIRHRFNVNEDIIDQVSRCNAIFIVSVMWPIRYPCGCVTPTPITFSCSLIPHEAGGVRVPMLTHRLTVN